MGYDVRMIVGYSSMSSPEKLLDLSRPYSDGSGYAYKKDEQGDDVLTGRTETYFSVVAEVELCKLGGCSLSELIAKSKPKYENATSFCYFYGTGDGNTSVKVDNYGDVCTSVPIKDVLKAMRKSFKKGEYRRIDWTVALLKALPDNFEVIFYGH